MRKTERAAWITSDETEYLRSIVTRVGKLKAERILTGYLKAVSKRVKWNYIKSEAAFKLADELLTQLEMNP